MSLTEILTKSRNINDQIRKQAECDLEILASNNFGKLLDDCSREMANESSVKENRQLCGTLIKNMILYQEQHRGKWEQLSIDLKLSIKNHVLSCLASDLNDIRKAAASTVAGICKLEIPRGEWPGIIDVLIETSTNENRNFRLASIITIGYISQELNPTNLSSDQVDKILGALVNSMQCNSSNSDIEILLQSITSFLNFLIFAKKNMETPNEREFIFETIFALADHAIVDIRVYAMQCLVEISRIYYDQLQFHMAKLLAVTEQHMLEDDVKVGIQAFEFWCSISDEEIYRSDANIQCYYFCNTAIDNLFNICLKHFLNRNAEIERLEEDSWNCTKAASCLLTNMCQCTGPILIDKVFDMIRNHINSENPKIRDSTILAFASILETRNTDKIKAIIPGALPTILEMLNDDSLEVRITVSWCLKKITEFHSDCLKNAEMYDLFMSSIIDKLTSHKKVVVQMCDSISFLATYVNTNKQSDLVSKHMEVLLNTLLKVAFTKSAYDCDSNVALAAFYSIGTLIDYAPLDTLPIIQNFFVHIYNAFESTLHPENFNSKEIRYAYQGYIASVISSSTVNNQVTMTLYEAMAVYKLIKESFVQRNTLYEEGIMACSSIAMTVGGGFCSIIEDFGSYLLFGLSQWEDVGMCRMCVNSTSDLIRAMMDKMDQYIPTILPPILNILEKETSDKYLKTQAFYVISDMFCYNKEMALMNYERIMNIVCNALTASVYQTDKQDDIDLHEYFKSLRERLLECLVCIIQCLKDSNRMSYFDPYVHQVLEFSEKIIDDQYDPSYEIYSGCLGVIGDLCEAYGKNVKGMINIQKVKTIINRLDTCSIERYVKLVEWAKHIIQSVII